jgi:hypothetical protein
VNLVNKSWLDYGFQCQEIYLKTREKIAVFPLDWLVIQNVVHVETSVFSNDTLFKLQEAFHRVYKNEKKAREIIERLI